MSYFKVACHFFLVLVFAFSSRAEDCKWVKLKADGYIAYHEDKLNMKYEMQSITNDGKNVFKRDNGDEYIYWKQTTYSWMVGSTLGSTVVSMYTFSNESHPADIPQHQTWFAASGFFWASYSSIRVECTARPLEAWEIGLIIGGSVLFVAILLGVCIHCINKKKKDNTNVSPVHYDTTTGIHMQVGRPPPYSTQGQNGAAGFQGPPGYYHQGYPQMYPYSQSYDIPGSVGGQPTQHMKPRLPGTMPNLPPPRAPGAGGSSGLPPLPGAGATSSALPPLPTRRPAADSGINNVSAPPEVSP